MSFWYCSKCGFGPHDPAIHGACIMCGTVRCSELSQGSREDPVEQRVILTQTFRRLRHMWAFIAPEPYATISQNISSAASCPNQITFPDVYSTSTDDTHRSFVI